MSFSNPIPAAEIGQIFEEEILALGGRLHDRFANEIYLFARSTLPAETEVQKGDRVQGGVALMSTAEEIRVHPYVFRQVCSNGAIRAHAVETRRIAITDDLQGFVTADALREAVRACAAPRVIYQGVSEMRSALEQQADMALTLMPMLSHFPERQRTDLLMTIFRRFGADGDRSRFGLMNAITSTARDTADPETRWRLEELGGGVPIASLQTRPAPGTLKQREVVTV